VPDDLERLAELVRIKNEADLAIAQLIGRPSTPGNIGEFVAASVFAIRLMTSGSHPGYDGVFQSGPFADKTVNIKTYSRHESVLDISPHPCDYYLVLTGPPGQAKIPADAHPVRSQRPRRPGPPQLRPHHGRQHVIPPCKSPQAARLDHTAETMPGGGSPRARRCRIPGASQTNARPSRRVSYSTAPDSLPGAPNLRGWGCVRSAGSLVQIVHLGAAVIGLAYARWWMRPRLAVSPCAWHRH
jgi:hypothetical protein